MKNILIPTDFSNNAYNALFYATALFHHHECTFFILNSFTEVTPLKSVSLSNGKHKSLIEQLGDESVEGLQHSMHRINLDDDNPKHRFELLSRKGSFINTLQHAVAENDIDLVVMGTTGATGNTSVFLGSNTTKAMAALKACPVLAIPLEKEFSMPYEIAFASDYRRNFDAKILEPLRFMSKLCSAAVRIVHINEQERLDKQQEGNLNTLLAYMKPLPHSIHWMPHFASKTKTLQTFLDELGIGMLAMIRYEHGFVKKLLREPVIEKMAFHLSIPFLVIPAED
ncbi:universal stress protein [Flavobacteriaceae bacterium TP-CH-4]|uniref:Universal stress protein n=1 Tax=Pelagihabitans pacificus TaxID=2696054 RepID=A0A967AP25_9FLAO|nr:universal stress protein [Pelagihabitans pacificus]NHF57728.1 universal stress protein [Pelagihabitans pacificus]